MKMKKSKKGYRYGGMAGDMSKKSGMMRSNMAGNGYRNGGMAKGGGGSGVGRLQKSRMAAKSGKVMTKRGYGMARKG
ncbi:MAG: hypothetical protein V6Z86_05765 [Hyphomicrobiales bacterium]